MNSIMSLVAFPGKRAFLVESRGFFRRALLTALGAAFAYCALAAGAKADIRFVQQNYAVPHPSGSPAQITYTNAQTAGNLNIVVVGWNDATTTVSTVTDSAGNTYQLAIGPTRFTGATAAENLSQSIYYAANIRGAGAGTNTVTVTFNRAAPIPDIRILEYSGIVASSPVDGTMLIRFIDMKHVAVLTPPWLRDELRPWASWLGFCGLFGLVGLIITALSQFSTYLIGKPDSLLFLALLA